ncbi:hypothetical protein P154DRAFT_187904 [Amniculicola lignicola CBS 123094]|uniref:Uncharacterized protein n=1 Tax=Amniculicola lignicola CBS 123094 TaxID=1392246 RepID=A0A6A5WJY2_9PLEO|nr:hypothetical protein P154DRAFT_187904 [Amniculicola lignicola CBS 123094]
MLEAGVREAFVFSEFYLHSSFSLTPNQNAKRGTQKQHFNATCPVSIICREAGWMTDVEIDHALLRCSGSQGPKSKNDMI